MNPPSPLPVSALDRRLTRWSRANSLLLTGALAATSVGRNAWPLSACAALSFTTLLWVGWRAYTPLGRFGWANRVTTLRVAFILVLTAPSARVDAHWAFLIALAVLGLDLGDGWLARRCGDASRFGAHFDMESDALLVLALTLRLWLGGGFAAWVLLAGALRYAYVLAIWCWPETREAPRSSLGRYAFAVSMVGLLGGLVLPQPSATFGVLVGSLVLAASFARSAYFSRITS